MSGLSAFIFGMLCIAFYAVVYKGGLNALIGGGVVLGVAWLTGALIGWSDALLIIMQAFCWLFVLGTALRWCLRHRAWQERIAKDRGETQEKQIHVQRYVDDLKEKISAKAANVERAMKQYELIKRLAEALSWEEMSPSLDRAIKHFFQSDSWILYLTDEQDQMQLVQRRGAIPEPAPEKRDQKEPSLELVPAAANNAHLSLWSLCMPLWRLHERIGLLCVKMPHIEESQKAAIITEAASFSTQLIFAMAKAKLYRELEQRSRTDGLTGLSRRGPFEERLKEEVARASSFKTTFSILMIDIDHFKRFNDNYGHQVGDDVLKIVSQRIREALYETDVIARYGGEEFVCLMPRSDPAGLRTKANQIRQRVCDHSFIVGVETLQITISIGIAHFPRDGQVPEAIMAAADKALYAAKAAGRNCVIEATAA